jgi:cell division protein FtsB
MSAQPHGLSGQQIAKSNLLKFQKWIIQRDLANDWISYLRGEKLNRSEIASECCFSLSVLRQNPAIKDALESLEKRLREIGIIVRIGQTVSHLKLVSAGLTVDRRVMAEKSISDKRIKELEGQNASLRAEIHDLRDQISRFKQLDDHLSKTGRLLHR